MGKKFLLVLGASLSIQGATTSVLAAEKKNPCAGRKVAFTFDDGPKSPSSNKILETLKANSIPATFFVTGKNFQTYQTNSNVKQFVDEVDSNPLFDFGNHTRSHLAGGLTHYPSATIERELAALKVDPPYATDASGNVKLDAQGRKMTVYDDIISRQKNETDKKPREFFRAPYGATGGKEGKYPVCPSRVCSKIGNAGYGGHVFWHVDSRDWQRMIGKKRSKSRRPGPGSSPERLMRQFFYDQTEGLYAACKDKKFKGQTLVLLFHDIHENTAKTLPAIVEKLKKDGLVFAGLDGIMNDPKNEAWKKVEQPTLNERSKKSESHSAGE